MHCIESFKTILTKTYLRMTVIYFENIINLKQKIELLQLYVKKMKTSEVFIQFGLKNV